MLQVHPPNPPDPQPVHAEVTLRDHRRPPPYRHCEPLYVRLSSTRHASSANSHSSGRVSRGSMISSTPNFSAVRNGERTRFRRSRIASRCASGSAATSNSLLYATSTPPSIGRLPEDRKSTRLNSSH